MTQRGGAPIPRWLATTTGVHASSGGGARVSCEGCAEVVHVFNQPMSLENTHDARYVVGHLRREPGA